MLFNVVTLESELFSILPFFYLFILLILLFLLLGYLVHSGIRRSRGVQGMLLMVQTDHSADHAEGRMEAFLHSVKVTHHHHLR